DAIGRRLVVVGLLLGAAASVATRDDERVLVPPVLGAIPGSKLRLARLAPVQGPIGALELVLDLHVRRAVPDSLPGRLARGFNAHGRPGVAVHAPHGDGHHMRAPVADLAAAKLEK